jgi:hypothetical protein
MRVIDAYSLARLYGVLPVAETQQSPDGEASAGLVRVASRLPHFRPPVKASQLSTAVTRPPVLLERHQERRRRAEDELLLQT